MKLHLWGIASHHISLFLRKTILFKPDMIAIGKVGSLAVLAAW